MTVHIFCAMDDSSETDVDAPQHAETELAKRLKESENTYKLFGFSHIIVIGSITDIMDSSFRSIIDGMYRRTKSHCKSDQEAELYQQQLCKLYLTCLKKGLTHVDLLEPKLAKILAVKLDSPVDSLADKLAALRQKVAERTRRVQSLLAMQNRLKTDIVMAEWVISKVEPNLYEAEKEIANIECVSPNNFDSVVNSLNHVKTIFSSLKLD